MMGLNQPCNEEDIWDDGWTNRSKTIGQLNIMINFLHYALC